MEDNIDPVLAWILAIGFFGLWLILVWRDIRRERRERNMVRVFIMKNGQWVPAIITRDAQGVLQYLPDPDYDNHVRKENW